MIAVYAPAAKYGLRDTVRPRAFPQVRTIVKGLFMDADAR